MPGVPLMTASKAAVTVPEIGDVMADIGQGIDPGNYQVKVMFK